MSYEESNVKRLCVEKDNSQSPANSQSNDSAPIKSFRDLVFNVCGTMPAVEKSQIDQNTSTYSGKRKLDDCSASAKAYEKSCGADRKEHLAEMVNESDVGITEYVSELDGFGGILKQR